MLIGPTITLEDLEKHMSEKLNENKMELNKIGKETAKLRQKFQTTPKMTTEDDGDTVVNPEFLRLKEVIEANEKRVMEINDQNEFIEIRIADLEEIEDKSLGKVDKKKARITLTLNDCLMLGISDEEDEA